MHVLTPLSHRQHICVSKRIPTSGFCTTRFTARRDQRGLRCQVFAEWLKRRPDWVIGDFGCGEAELARLAPNKVYSFDHVAVNESVIVCDMLATGLAEHTLDVAVFSLSLMGLNYQDYLREAHRLVRYGGWLKVAEPASRWKERNLEELLGAITASGFAIVGQPTYRDRFIYLDAIKS